MGLLIIGIARGLTDEEIFPSFEAAIDGGFVNLEITMNTPEALKLINDAHREFKDRAKIGAGTVLTMEDLHNAIKAGAQFIVTPVVNVELIRFCKNNNIPVFPGALTPTEIYTAWETGATMVKVFPINRLGGADYIKDIKGPFDKIKILACNGVTPDNLCQYIKAGADGIAIGNNLFNKNFIKEKKFYKIKEIALAFTSKIND
jgi:2-dehydro-3-deoxyphosphogluconate aldolase/(4S)-4-hydroxy-2-oxoglutarate aldolase